MARQAVLLYGAHRLTPKADYTNAILDSVSHLLGRNVHGRSYVTGLGFIPPQKPHDRRCGADQVVDVDPWPGYLVGGPNPKAVDYVDEQEDYRTNEIAINWNAALIYALGALVE